MKFLYSRKSHRNICLYFMCVSIHELPKALRLKTDQLFNNKILYSLNCTKRTNSSLLNVVCLLFNTYFGFKIKNNLQLSESTCSSLSKAMPFV